MIATLTALLLAIQPASNAITIGECAAGRTPAVDRQGVAGSLREGRSPEQALVGRMVQHVESCAAGAQAPVDALTVAMARVAQIEMGAELGRLGIDTRLVDRWFQRQGNARRTSLRITAQDGEAMGQELIAGGVPAGPLNAHPAKVGNYVGTLIIIERVRRGLPATE